MDDSAIRPRHISRFLAKAAQVSPVVVLMGARQTGKSTLAQEAPFPPDDNARLYVTLDDIQTRERAERAPDAFIRSAPRMTIDEVQRSPDLILAIKRAVDQDRPRKPGRFFLTGSANLLMMERISESLAGRATYLTLWPFTCSEKASQGRTGLWEQLIETSAESWPGLFDQREAQPLDWKSEAMRGGYPTPALDLASRDERIIWFDGYVRTYLERDLQNLAAIDNLIDFRRLMRAACLRLGQILNQAELGRDLQIPRPTVHRYLNLLEASYQLVRVPAYSVNRTKRLVKSPRLYWSDTGLAHFLSTHEEPTGAALENLILSDLLAWRDARVPRPEILYWRTTTGLEVDFVIEHSRGLLPIEIKASKNPGWNATKGLRAFLDEYPEIAPAGILVHTGDDAYWMADGILAVPISKLLDLRPNSSKE